MTDSAQTNGWYMNESAEKCTMLVAKVKLFARQNTDTNVIKAFKGEDIADAAERTKAKETLYDILCRQIACAKLIQTLEQSYVDDGPAALDYIKSLWHAGTDENRLAANHTEYKNIAWKQTLDETAEASTVREHLNKMTTLRNSLTGSDRAIPDKLFSYDMIDVVRDMGTQHAIEIKFQKGALEAVIDAPGKVAAILEGVALKARSDAPKKQSKLVTMVSEMAATKSDAEILAAMTQRPGNGKATRCKHCGIYHPGTCYAKLIADGKPVPGWDDMEVDQQERLNARAKKITDAATKPAIAMTEFSDMPSKRCGTGAIEIHVDSKAGAGFPYHYIADPTLFIQMDKMAEPINISGVGGGEAVTTHVGTCVEMC